MLFFLVGLLLLSVVAHHPAHSSSYSYSSSSSPSPSPSLSWNAFVCFPLVGAPVCWYAIEFISVFSLCNRCLPPHYAPLPIAFACRLSRTALSVCASLSLLRRIFDQPTVGATATAKRLSSAKAASSMYFAMPLNQLAFAHHLSLSSVFCHSVTLAV
jgi:hypothetical protein